MPKLTNSKDRATAAALKFCHEHQFVMSPMGAAFPALVDIIEQELRKHEIEVRQACLDEFEQYIKTNEVCDDLSLDEIKRMVLTAGVE